MTINKNTKNNSKTELHDTLGERVKWLRQAKGWTQTDLANMAGVTYQNIQFCEKNKIKMPRYIKELADALETSIEFLLNGEVEPNVVRLEQHISIVSVDTPIKPDQNIDYYVIKIEKDKQLFVAKDTQIVGKVNKVFIGHTN